MPNMERESAYANQCSEIRSAGFLRDASTKAETQRASDRFSIHLPRLLQQPDSFLSFPEMRERKDLQFALHAHACSSHCTLSVQQACCTLRDPLWDEIREVSRGLSLADTQTG